MKKNIDLNCDLGEWRTPDGVALDEAIMPYISSCNIACGGHIGDEHSIRTTIQLAKKFGVSVGAHPSYPDQENFGRVIPNITQEELSESLKSQIQLFKNLVEEEGSELHHIKPHGALYNYAVKDEETALTLLSVIKKVAPNIPVYLPQGSISASVAEDFGIRVINEVFADRAYEDDLSLRSRTLSGAVLDDEADVIAQLRSMVLNNQVLTHSGLLKPIKVQTVCLHSDTAGAVQLSKTIYTFLTSHGVKITTA